MRELYLAGVRVEDELALGAASLHNRHQGVRELDRGERGQRGGVEAEVHGALRAHLAARRVPLVLMPVRGAQTATSGRPVLPHGVVMLGRGLFSADRPCMPVAFSLLAVWHARLRVPVASRL